MKYLSLFSGIEAATVGWDDFGWKCVGVSEVDPFACAVLKHRWPKINNLGDVTKIDKERINGLKEEHGFIDIVVGGSPCQSFSSAGTKKGLEDPRGRLMLDYIRIVGEVRPTWFLWENVPGALSTEEGRAFGTLITKMAELGYSLCWRVLDSQYFGVPQRRKRVFLVGHIGKTSSAFQVLFDREGGEGDIGESCEKGKSHTTKPQEGAREHREAWNVTFCDANGTRKDRPNGGVYINKVDKSSTCTTSGVGNTLVVDHILDSELAGTLCARDYKGPASDDMSKTTQKLVVETYREHDFPNFTESKVAAPLRVASHTSTLAIEGKTRVRKLTLIECERLQGFPDNYTKVPYGKKTSEECPRGPRYKVLGNSMAVPVMRWIGQRIKWTDARNKSILARQKEECDYDICTTWRGCICTPSDRIGTNTSYNMDSLG
jgi:DNA (cytosine-5)-methyltransferase 1